MTRTALVTGANRGIGLAIAQRLAELRHAVWLGSRDPGAGESAAAELRRAGLDVTAVRLDLADPGSIDAAVDAIESSGRHVSVLVNNAGVLHQRPLLELADAEIDESIAVHLTGPIRLVRRVEPHMSAEGFGRIVNVSSDWGSFSEGLGGPGAYGITKAALNALTVRCARKIAAGLQGAVMRRHDILERSRGASVLSQPGV